MNTRERSHSRGDVSTLESGAHTRMHTVGYIRRVARVGRGCSPDSGTDLYLRGRYSERLTLELRWLWVSHRGVGVAFLWVPDFLMFSASESAARPVSWELRLPFEDDLGLEVKHAGCFQSFTLWSAASYLATAASPGSPGCDRWTKTAGVGNPSADKQTRDSSKWGFAPQLCLLISSPRPLPCEMKDDAKDW